MHIVYVDESGYLKWNASRDFFVALVEANNKQRLKKVFQRFVSSHIDELKRLDGTENKMFDRNGVFRELKGSQFDYAMKVEFLEYFAKGDQTFTVHIIQINNRKTEEIFYRNQARAFNYVLKLLLQSNIRSGQFAQGDICLQIDERNVRTESRHTLEDYLDTEIMLATGRRDSISVQYFASECNFGVQIADVFANVLFSNSITGNYEGLLNQLIKTGFLKPSFQFPLSKG